MDRSISNSIAFVSPFPIVHKWGALRLPGGSGALVTGVNIDGFKHVLGIWLASSEGVLLAACISAGGTWQATVRPWDPATRHPNQ